MFLLFLASLIGTIATIATTVATNKQNKQSVEDTNATNLAAVEATNAANAEQANLAYERSKPEVQVANMMQAGMSKPAALNSLAGGGTYTAPVMQSAQAQPNNFDFTKIGEAFERLENIPANVQQHKMVKAQIDAIKQETRQKAQSHIMELRLKKQEYDLKQEQELRNKYAHDVELATDDLRSEIVRVAQSKHIDISTLRNEDDVLRLVGNSPYWKAAPTAARDNVIDWLMKHTSEIYKGNDDYRAAVKDLREDDMHQLNMILKRSEVDMDAKTFHRRITKLNIELRKLEADASQAEIEEAVKRAGFKDRQEAEKFAAEAAKYKAAEDSYKARSNNELSPVLKDFGYSVDWLLDKVNILKGIKIGN